MLLLSTQTFEILGHSGGDGGAVEKGDGDADGRTDVDGDSGEKGVVDVEGGTDALKM